MISLASAAAAPLLARVRRRARPPEPLPPPPPIDTMRGQAFLDLAEEVEAARLAHKRLTGEVLAAEGRHANGVERHANLRDDLSLIAARDARHQNHRTSRGAIEALSAGVRDAGREVDRLARELVALRSRAEETRASLEEVTARITRSLDSAEDASQFLALRESHAERAVAGARAALVAASAESSEAKVRRLRPRSVADVDAALDGSRVARAESALTLAGERLAKAEADMRSLSRLRETFTRAVESALQYPGKD